MKNENTENGTQENTTHITISLKDYLFSNSSYWYWLIIILSCLTSLFVILIGEEVIPLVYFRHVLGAIFIMILPGYCLIKILFPKSGIDNFERTALSIGMSIALVSLVALLLSFTPWGIRTIPITLTLLTITIVLATIAIIRDYQVETYNK